MALAIRDALRAGNLFLTQSREHVSFWNLIHDERSWQESRGEAYRRLNLLAACRTEVFSQALRSAVTGLAEPADLAFSW